MGNLAFATRALFIAACTAPGVNVGHVVSITGEAPNGPLVFDSTDDTTTADGTYVIQIGSSTGRWKMPASLKDVADGDTTNAAAVVAAQAAAAADATAKVLATKPIDFAIGFAAATYASTTALTVSHVVYRVRVKVVTQFSVGTTLNVGQAGHTTDFAASAGDAVLTDLSQIPAGGTYDIEGRTAVAAALAVLATIGGSPAAGAGFVTVWAEVPAP